MDDEQSDERDDEIDDTSPADISSNNTSDDVLAKKKTKSAIWNFFTKTIFHVRREVVSCRTCKKMLLLTEEIPQI